MRFSDVIRGTSAECTTHYESRGKRVEVLLRPLDANEEMDVVASAIKHCKARGADAVAGNPIYEAGIMAASLAIAVLDPDSPEEARAPHFDKGDSQVLQLDTDTIATLYEQQMQWQEETSPSLKAKSVGELFDIARKLVEQDDPLVYARLSPRTRWDLQRTTAALLLESHVLKPSPTSSSSSDGTSSKTTADARRPPSRKAR
jgi:hypothetical protein